MGGFPSTHTAASKGHLICPTGTKSSRTGRREFSARYCAARPAALAASSAAFMQSASLPDLSAVLAASRWVRAEVMSIEPVLGVAAVLVLVDEPEGSAPPWVPGDASTPLAWPPAIAPVEPVPVVAAPLARAGGRIHLGRAGISTCVAVEPDGAAPAWVPVAASTPLGWPPATVPVAPSAVVPFVVSAAWACRRGRRSPPAR